MQQTPHGQGGGVFQLLLQADQVLRLALPVLQLCHWTLSLPRPAQHLLYLVQQSVAKKYSEITRGLWYLPAPANDGALDACLQYEVAPLVRQPVQPQLLLLEPGLDAGCGLREGKEGSATDVATDLVHCSLQLPQLARYILN